MIIYRNNGTEILKVRPDDNDKCTKRVMSQNTVSLTARLSSPFLFQVGDYVMFAGEKYTLNILPKVKKEDSLNFVYDLVFEGIEYELRKVRMLFYTANLVYAGGADFSLMGDAELQARVIVENLNRVQSGWTLGSVITSEAKNLTYSNNNCLEAITRIAEEFGTEYWVGTDKTINIGKRGDILPVTFKYGKNKGLYSIERTNVNSKDIVTRLYPFGSEQNLPKGYRNNSKRLQIEGAYIENNTSLYGIIESSQTFEEIKPERTGTISAVNGSDVLEFTDSSMDFDINATDEGGNTTVLIPGTTAKIHFQTGDLAGYEFELSLYNHTTKTFRLVKFTDEVAYDLPNSTLKPRVGDKYIILDIYMPATYVADAEARLLAKTQESLAQNSVPNVAYKVQADPLFIKRLGQTYKEGDYVHVEDEDISVDRDIRIVGLERNLVNTDIYDFELADTVEPSLASQIITQLENQDTVLKINNLKDPARARRNYKATTELITMIQTVQAEAALIGNDPAAQYSLSQAIVRANYSGDPNSLFASSCVLAHNYYPEGNPGEWNVTEFSVSDLNPLLPYYIYIKASKTTSLALYILSAAKIAVEEVSGFYHFPFGVLSSVIDGARVLTTTKGYTLITGDSIKTGKIQHPEGNTYFDLENDEIGGRIHFKDGLVSGLIGVGPDANTINAGMNGEGTEENSIRLWAGASAANRETAPWRVQHNGHMFSAGWEFDEKRLYKENGDVEMVIDSEEMSLKMFLQGVAKLLLTGYDLPLLDSLKNPSSGTVYPTVSNVRQNVNGASVTYSVYSSNIVSLPNSNANYGIRVNYTKNALATSVNASAYANVYLVNSSNVRIRKIGVINLRFNGNYNNVVTVSSFTEAGSYKIELEVYYSDYSAYPGVYAGGTLTLGGAQSDSAISYSEQIQASIIGRNGIASYWNSDKFFYLSQIASYFLELNGNTKINSSGNGIDITSTGVALKGIARTNKVNYIAVTASNPTQDIQFSADCVLVRFFDGYNIVLPTKESVASALGLASTESFSVSLKIVCRRLSNNGAIWGRNSTLSGKNTDSYPYWLNNNADSQSGSLAIGQGDVVEFQLIYYSGEYYAYMLNLRQ